MKSFSEYADVISEDMHARYMRAHGKKAKGVGSWMFTTKRMGEPNEDEVWMSKPSSKLSDAAKEAKKFFKTKDIYVMESVEQVDEAAPKIKGSKPKGSGSIKDIRGSDGNVYDVNIQLSGRKIEFKVKDTMSGDFKTISLAQAAKLFK